MNEKSTAACLLDQQLADALRPGSAPEDLRRSLLRAAESRGPRRIWRVLGIAATLMLLLGWGAWGWIAHWNRHEGERFSQAALQNYMGIQRLDFIVDASAQESAEQRMERCKRWSIEAAGFEAHLPKGLADQPLKGGSARTMASCRVACYSLQDGRAVYVFDREIKGLDAQSSQRPLIHASGHRTSAWNEDGRGYILVERS